MEETTSLKLQEQFDNIYRYFKSTTEYFDTMDWNGEVLELVLNNEIIGKYLIIDLKELKIEI